jgi:hypothetical protein
MLLEQMPKDREGVDVTPSRSRLIGPVFLRGRCRCETSTLVIDPQSLWLSSSTWGGGLRAVQTGTC